MPRKDYRKQLQIEAEKSRIQSAAKRDIGKAKKVTGQKRREKAKKSLEFFLKTYFPNAFHLKFGDDHRKNIEKIEEAARNGGQFALAMPRGSGKTTICERAALWAVLFGLRKFVCIVGATEGKATDTLSHIKTELSFNEKLRRDFPVEMHGIWQLENNARRCVGQLSEGKQTRITWSSTKVVMPSVPGSQCGGSILTVSGLTGSIRGQSHTTTSGEIHRPDFCLVDDPQTRESSSSMSQCRTRLKTIQSDVLGLSGPNRKIAAVMPLTVISKGDLADEILNRKLHPEWKGERTKMLISFPSNLKLWEEYKTIRDNDLIDGGNGKKATAFYRKNRKAMDDGAIVSWSERKHPGELSAVQHAMNLFLTDSESFWSEYQNDPLEETQSDFIRLTSSDIAGKTNGLERNISMSGSCVLTAFVDVQGSSLWYTVVSWTEDFTGSVVDYGVFPEQNRNYIELRKIQRTLAKQFPGHGLEASINAGLNALIHEDLLKRDFRREDGIQMGINLLLIDANWGESTQTVRDFCRRSPFRTSIIPSHGKGIKAINRPMSEWQKKNRQQVGLNWRSSTIENLKHAVYDTNFWKTFLHGRLAVPFGDPGSLTLHGTAGKKHTMLADHCVAEYRTRVTANGRSVDEWQLRPDRPDNHFFDCLVGCAVGASIMGAKLQTNLIVENREADSVFQKTGKQTERPVPPVQRQQRKKRRRVTYF